MQSTIEIDTFPTVKRQRKKTTKINCRIQHMVYGVYVTFDSPQQLRILLNRSKCKTNGERRETRTRTSRNDTEKQKMYKNNNNKRQQCQTNSYTNCAAAIHMHRTELNHTPNRRDKQKSNKKKSSSSERARIIRDEEKTNKLSHKKHQTDLQLKVKSGI